MRVSAIFVFLALAFALLFSSGCASSGQRGKSANNGSGPSIDLPREWIDPEVFRPTPRVSKKKARRVASPIVLRHATILTAAGKHIEDGTVVVQKGKITAVGNARIATPKGAREIDATGRFITPGIIDTHSHIGVYPAPHVKAHSDGNEATSPVTAEVRAAYAYWPQDPAIVRAQAGGVTSAQILPGSANLVGGRGIIVEMRTGQSINDVVFLGAPATLKMACGENPKRVYGERAGPSTRMAEYARFRAVFEQATSYKIQNDLYAKQRKSWKKRQARAKELDAKSDNKIKPEPAPERPKHDAKLETLAGVLRGDVLVQIHCYRASDIRQMVAIADDFGFSIRSFHHALEAYKVRDLLVDHHIAINTWADWWGFKMEAFDGIPENAALFTRAGGRAVIHSDSSIDIQHLNQEAAKAMHAGNASGVPITEDQALRWITANAAWVMGIDKHTGTIEVGKRGDLVVWDKHPFSVYAKADLVLIFGEVVFDRKTTGLVPTDFELGNSALSEGR